MAKSPRFDVRWTRAAEMDLTHLVEFICLESPQSAEEQWERIRNRVSTLSTFPWRTRLVPELKGIGLDIYRELVIPPFRVLVRITAQRVLVLGVFDGRRDLEEVLFQRLTRD
jgi:toxin ParE1/3/4